MKINEANRDMISVDEDRVIHYDRLASERPVLWDSYLIWKYPELEEMLLKTCREFFEDREPDEKE
jgi:hypothetical protein